MGWFGKSNTSASAERGCIGIEFHRSRAYAVLNTAQGVTLCYSPDENEQGLSGLEKWLLANQLTGLPVVISLDTLDYQLHLVEAPKVADDELSDALRFRLRDLLPAGRDDLMVRGFRLPGDAYRGRMDMAFAAVVEKNVIRELVSWCRRQQLELAGITIPELSLLNLLAEYEPESAVGVLRMDEGEGVIYLYREGALYVTRRLNIGVKAFAPADSGLSFALDTSASTDALALEVQRSLDYFDSQLGMGMVSQIWVLTPDGDDISATLPALEKAINTEVRPLVPEGTDHGDKRPLTASLAIALGNALLCRGGSL